MVTNSLVKQKSTFSSFLTSPTVSKKISEMIQGKDGSKFTTALISAVSNNNALAECEYMTIFSAALLGEALKLSPSPQLGQYYLVPFNNKKKINGEDIWVKEAQFQLGYKGYIQLAIRSGQYKKLNVLAIKKGELEYYDPLNEELKVNLIENDTERENAETIGYYAMFEYTNGFRKTMYWSKEKMEAHALQYSQGYKKDIQKGTNWTFWSKDFDGMAYKTMLRQLISKWGIMSIEMQQAIDSDMAVIRDDGKVDYVDNIPQLIEGKVIEHPSTKHQEQVQEPEIINTDNDDPLLNFGEERA